MRLSQRGVPVSGSMEDSTKDLTWEWEAEEARWNALGVDVK